MLASNISNVWSEFPNLEWLPVEFPTCAALAVIWAISRYLANENGANQLVAKSKMIPLFPHSTCQGFNNEPTSPIIQLNV